MARQRLRGESAPSQTVEQEARFAGVTKRRYQQVLQATREDLGLAPPNSGGRPPAAAVQGDAEALDLERMLELQAETIEAQQRAAAGLAAQVMAAAVQQLAECRQLWPGGVDTAARLVCPLLGGMPPTPYMPWASADRRGRRAAVLWPGLSRAALLVFRLGEIEDDALVSLLDCHTKTPAGLRRAGFAPILARGWPLWGVGDGQCAEFSLYTYHIHLRWNDAARLALLGGVKPRC